MRINEEEQPLRKHDASSESESDSDESEGDSSSSGEATKEVLPILKTAAKRRQKSPDQQNPPPSLPLLKRQLPQWHLRHPERQLPPKLWSSFDTVDAISRRRDWLLCKHRFVTSLARTTSA